MARNPFWLTAAVVALWALTIPVWLTAQHEAGGEGAMSRPQVANPRGLAQSVHRNLGCADCHGEAEMLGRTGGDMGGTREMGAETAERRPNPVNTCARCHQQAMAAYVPSVHAAAVRRGAPNAATCVACHGSHSVIAVGDPQSPVSHLRVSEDTCARCHEPASAAFGGRQPNVVTDYRHSFHGLSLALGDHRVATCVNCHSSHEIRPARDPLSTISAPRMYQTCAACHAGTAPGFAAGGVHHNPTLPGHRSVDIVGFMYLMTIVIVISSMVLHNGLDFWGRLRERWTQWPGKPTGPPPDAQQPPAPAAAGYANRPGQAAAESSPTHLRFTITERVQHWTLAASFGLLALTGFALVYALRIPFVEAQQGALLRGVLHRAAAVVFIALSVFHVGYVLLTRRGRENLHATLPHVHSAHDWFCRFAACFRLGPPSGADWRDLVQTVKYNLGVVPTRPAMGRFTYAEKMEYLAMLWGSGVMIVTGLILWSAVPFLNRFPYWVYDLVTTVHFYEALLATLSVFAWHFYYTIYNPHVFPLATTMVTGRISHEDMERDHALELRPPEEHAAHDEPAASDTSPA